jgi:hypothetical protein
MGDENAVRRCHSDDHDILHSPESIDSGYHDQPSFIAYRNIRKLPGATNYYEYCIWTAKCPCQADKQACKIMGATRDRNGISIQHAFSATGNHKNLKSESASIIGQTLKNFSL